ncbi:phage/plasmid primase, P4 family [Ligilactobacillus acidipiscis]|uniref:DNA primase family protein n=1 Tax=Ligilactobacillus acidipiscis TaxID=89059 RepID=UPI003867520C
MRNNAEITPKELAEMDEQRAQMAEQAAKANQSSNTLNEGLEPYNVDFTDKPDDDITPDQLREYNKEINAKTPSWLNIYFTWKGPKNAPYLVFGFRVDEVKLGNAFLRMDKMLSFPKLKDGAIYQPKTGSWRPFKDNEVVKHIGSKISKTLAQWNVYNSGQSHTIRNYITDVMFHTEILNNPFEDAKPYLVAFKNGTYNMETGQLQNKDPKNYLLSGHNFNLEISDEPTPATDKYITASIGDAISYLKEYIGYGFYHSYKPFQHILFLHGEGGEGKSTFLGMLTNEFYGIDNISAVAPEELAGKDSRFKPAELYGKEMNIVSDIAKGYLANPAILKKLSGGDDYISAEFKGQQNFIFRNYAKMIFSANDLPTFSETVGGFKDRLKVIDFINGDTRHNPSWWDQFDFDAIKAEHSRFVYQCMKLFMVAKSKHQLSETEEMKQATGEWINENDHFGQFLDEACILTPGDNKGESSQDVVAEYKAFCQANGYAENTSTQTITSKLKPLGIIKKTAKLGYKGTGNMKRYIGLKLTKHYSNVPIE